MGFIRFDLIGRTDIKKHRQAGAINKVGKLGNKTSTNLCYIIDYRTYIFLFPVVFADLLIRGYACLRDAPSICPPVYSLRADLSAVISLHFISFARLKRLCSFILPFFPSIQDWHLPNVSIQSGYNQSCAGDIARFQQDIQSNG